MSANVYGIEGEFRQFTPSEVGLVIKMSRKSMGLKREVLAAFARVTDKTIQRAESGERVCEKSSQRIATALGLAQDTFTMQRFIPHLASPEESQRHERQLNEAWAQTHLAVTVRELRDVRDVLPLLTTDAFWVDATNGADAHRQRFAALQQMVTEASDQVAEAPRSNRVELTAFELARGNLRPEPGRQVLMQTRKEVERGWRALHEFLNSEGQRELAADVSRFVVEMPVPRTEKEQIALALLHRVHQPRQFQLGLDQRHQELAR